MMIELTSQQSSILAIFSQCRGKSLFLQANCPESFELSPDDRRLKVESSSVPHILRLRQKIEKDVSNPKYIQTVRGRGYRFQEK